MAARARHFFFNDTATTEIYPLSLHDALPIWTGVALQSSRRIGGVLIAVGLLGLILVILKQIAERPERVHALYHVQGKQATYLYSYTEFRRLDRKSTRLNSIHSQISYAVFCL